MKVIFDISVLGWSIRNIKAKTGVFRVIENLLFEFIKNDSIDLYLSSIDGNFIDCHLYLKNLNIKLNPDKILFSNDLNKFKEKVFKFLKSIILFLENYFPKVSQNKIQNTVIFLFFPIYFFLNLYEYFISIPKEYLNREYVFHSPYLPIPVYILKSKIKKFITIYDIIPIIFPEYFLNNKNHLNKKILNSITPEINIFTISNHTKNDILKYYPTIQPEKITVIYLAASDLFYHEESEIINKETKSKYGINSKSYILSLCTIEPRKNLKVIIESFLNSIDKGKLENVNLVLVGAKGWDFSIQNIIAKYDKKLLSRIQILGFVPDENLASIYSNALFFVYMSFYEGFGLPPLEAMKCGLPVIVSNSSSIPEVVGSAGIYLDPNDSIKLSSTMENLFESEALRNELSKKSSVQASKFTWKKCANETIKGFKESYVNIN
jgi:glycosyltransferase involved in cell wall biosynthesis